MIPLKTKKRSTLAKPKKKDAAKKVSWPTVIIVIIIIVALLALSVFAYIGSSDKTSQLSAYSDSWNDISKFREKILAQKDFEGDALFTTSSIVSSPTMLNKVQDLDETLLVVMGVEKEYSNDEAQAIHDYVDNGGNLILADDFGYANSVAYYHFNVFFFGSRLWDDQYEKNPRFIKIGVNTDFWSGEIMFNEPSAMETTRGRNTEKAHSSQNSWVDLDNNGERGYADTDDDGVPDQLEISQEYAVMIEIKVGDGKAWFISDPSLFINDMWNRSNNADFATSLVEYLLPNGGEVIFEESRHIQNSPLDNAQQVIYEALVILTTDDQLTLVTVTLALLALGVLIIVMENPSELRHRFDLGHITLRNLHKPFITHEDCDRIRYLFLEKVRIAYGLSPEDFKELSVDELSQMIRDPDLIDFALDWERTIYGQDLEKILLKIRKWS